jgi:hypothetical protein
MNRFIDSGVEIYTEPVLPELVVTDHALADLELLVNSASVIGSTAFNKLVEYNGTVDITAPEVLGPATWGKLLGHIAMQTNYGREFATVDVKQAIAEEDHTKIALAQIACFKANHAGFIFAAHAELDADELAPATFDEMNGRMRQVYEALGSTGMPVARILAETPAPIGSTKLVAVPSLLEHGKITGYIEVPVTR